MDTQTLFDMELDKKSDILDTSYIFDNVTFELEEYMLEEQIESDSEDGLFSLTEAVTNRLQDESDEMIGDGTNKKRFIKSLTRIFALLLNTKVDTVGKIKKNTENHHRNNTKNMARTKVTPKRRPKTRKIPPWLMNKRQKRQRTKPYKIKLTLPEQKIVNITKDGNVMKTIQVRRRSKYFGDRWVRQF